MSTEAARNKRISIHDYPEHLNPFSEKHHSLDSYDKRKIFVDKLRHKNGTWSTKISQRLLGRSVSWLEKPRSFTEESRSRGNRIKDDDHINRSSNDTNLSDSSQNTIRVSSTEMKTSDNAKDEIRPEVRRRKKRPAPLPPVNDAIDTTQMQQITRVSNVDVELEKKDSDNEKISHRIVDKLIERMDDITRETITNDTIDEQVTTTMNTISNDSDCENVSIRTLTDDLQQTLTVADESCDENHTSPNDHELEIDGDGSHDQINDNDLKNEELMSVNETTLSRDEEIKSCKILDNEIVENPHEFLKNDSVSSIESENIHNSLIETNYNGKAVTV